MSTWVVGFEIRAFDCEIPHMSSVGDVDFEVRAHGARVKWTFGELYLERQTEIANFECVVGVCEEDVL